MKYLVSILLALFVVNSARADACATRLMPAFTAAQARSLCTKLGGSLAISQVPQTANSLDLGSPSLPWRSIYAGTSLVFSAGANEVLTAYVPTMAATPVAGTNQVLPGLNIVPTAAANTAAFLGAATPVAGQQFRINNSGPNAIRIKASGAATLNGATAGGYIAVPSLASIDCFTASTGNQVCLQPVIPTPAGP